MCVARDILSRSVPIIVVSGEIHKQQHKVVSIERILVARVNLCRPDLGHTRALLLARHTVPHASPFSNQHRHTCTTAVASLYLLILVHLVPLAMALKRKSSECDDAFSDYESCSLPRSDDCSVEVEGAGGSTRKRRRGLIEKRRRDRINDSLGELKRLVPSAVEKSTSTKLEKAEILQMTVDYLRNNQNRASNADYVDPRVAMDHQNIGFRDCIAEVSRYLVTVEGMDLQDPLRLRIMSHLHTFLSRGGCSGAAGGVGAGATMSWGGYHSTHGSGHHQYQPPPAPPASHKHTDTSHPAFSAPDASSYTSNRINTAAAVSSSSSASTYAPSPMYTTNAATAAVPYTPYTSPFHTPLSLHSAGPSATAAYQATPPGHGKPYRPWGTEMAY